MTKTLPKITMMVFMAIVVLAASAGASSAKFVTATSVRTAPDLVVTTESKVLNGGYDFLSGTSKRTVVNRMVAKTKKGGLEVLSATEYLRYAYKPSVPGGCGKPPCPGGSILLWGHRWWTYTEGFGYKLTSMGTGSCTTMYCSEVKVRGLYSFDYFMQPHYEACFIIKWGPVCKHFEPVIGIVANGDGTYGKYVR